MWRFVVAIVNRSDAELRPIVSTYITALFISFLLAVVPPVFFLTASVATGASSWAAVSGLWLSLFTALTIALASPLAYLVGIAARSEKIGESIVRFALSAMFYELGMTLFLVFIPVRNNPGLIPVFLVASLILAIAGFFKQGLIAIIGAVVVFLVCVFAFALPKTSAVIAERGAGFDSRLEQQLKAPRQPGGGQGSVMPTSRYYKGRGIAFGPGETQKTINLVPGQWSEWIITPPGSDYRTDPSADTFIKFYDGTVVKDGPAMVSHVGVKRGIFKFHGSGIVTVTIDR
jgi:hypothetical protein